MNKVIKKSIYFLGLVFMMSLASCDSPYGEENALMYIWFEVTGKVVDESGSPIEGITVSAESADPVQTDADGMFTLQGGSEPAESAAFRFVDDDNSGKQYISKTVMVDIEKYEDGHGWNLGYYRNSSELIVTMIEESVITPPTSDVEK